MNAAVVAGSMLAHMVHDGLSKGRSSKQQRRRSTSRLGSPTGSAHAPLKRTSLSGLVTQVLATQSRLAVTRASLHSSALCWRRENFGPAVRIPLDDSGELVVGIRTGHETDGVKALFNVGKPQLRTISRSSNRLIPSDVPAGTSIPSQGVGTPAAEIPPPAIVVHRWSAEARSAPQDSEPSQACFPEVPVRLARERRRRTECGHEATGSPELNH